MMINETLREPCGLFLEWIIAIFIIPLRSSSRFYEYRSFDEELRLILSMG